MVDKPVRPGDFIRVDTTYEGYVESIGWRSTHLRTLANNLVIIPNATLTKAIITNFTLPTPQMASSVRVDVAPDADLDKVEDALADEASRAVDVPGHGGGARPERGDGAGLRRRRDVAFTVYFHVRSFGEQVSVQHAVRKRIAARLAARGHPPGPAGPRDAASRRLEPRRAGPYVRRARRPRMTATRDARPHVVIVGGGFGGLTAAQALASAPVRVTLVDRTNHHTFQPLLYQVAMAGLSPADIAQPIRAILRDQRNATVLMAEVTGIDVDARRVRLADGAPLDWDFLVVACGATRRTSATTTGRTSRPGLKSIEDAMDIRERVLLAFERAERETDAARQRARC